MNRIAPEQEKVIDFSNSVLLQDEILYNVVDVIENGAPIGPAFAVSLATLIESVVFSERTYFDVFRCVSDADEPSMSVRPRLGQSDLIGWLQKEDLLTAFPLSRQIDRQLARAGIKYDTTDFANGFLQTPKTFYMEAAEESVPYAVGITLLKDKIGQLLSPQQLVPQSEDDSILFGEDARAAVLEMHGKQLGFERRSLVVIEGLNYRAKALLDLTNHLGLHLEPYFSALPHLLGAIRYTNMKSRIVLAALFENTDAPLDCFADQATAHALKELCRNARDPKGQGDVTGKFEAKRLLEIIYEKTDAIEAPPGLFQVPIDPLCEMAVRMCKGDPQALNRVLPELRMTYAPLRKSLTEIERKMPSLKTKGDVDKIRSQFEEEWTKTAHRDHNSLVRRLFIGLIDIAISPAELLGRVLKGLEATEIVGQLSNRIRGLHDFCSDLRSEPRSGANGNTLFALFPENELNEPAWKMGVHFSQLVNSRLNAG